MNSINFTIEFKFKFKMFNFIHSIRISSLIDFNKQNCKNSKIKSKIFLPILPSKSRTNSANTNGKSDPSPTERYSETNPEISLKMNKIRQLNNKAVVDEKERLADPKKFHSREKSRESKESDPNDWMENDPAELAQLRGKRQKGDGTFGWDVFNEDSLYRAHDKRVDKLGFYPDAYARQKEAVGEANFYSGVESKSHKPTGEAKDRLADSIKEQQDKRKKFSRRRMYNDEEDVQWINERNRHFTKKIDRAFGDHTAEIKANLERGTAL
jgi:hypothetical protein